MHLESTVAATGKSAQENFEALSIVSNYEKLMPENIAKFEVRGDDKFLFGLKGMPEIMLQIVEKTPYSQIVLKSPGDKLNFGLVANIVATSENTSDVQLHFDGEFNAMMAMMIKGPISKFLETLSGNMSKL